MTAATAPAPGGSLTLRAFRYWWFAYTKTWRGSVVSGIVAPVLYLAAMGVGLGHVVDHGTGTARDTLHVSYLTFIAPGLLASTVMQAAVTESTYPVVGSIRWQRNYIAAMATPLRVVDIMRGHLLWITARVTGVAVVFVAIMACFGTVHRAEALLAIPAAVLLGAAFCYPIAAFAAGRDSDQAFNVLFRLVMVPLFLFSGAFFPISQLPAGIRWVAWVTPLWHGTQLCRGFDLGTLSLGPAIGHIAYLAVLAGAGLVWAKRVYERRLGT